MKWFRERCQTLLKAGGALSVVMFVVATGGGAALVREIGPWSYLLFFAVDMAFSVIALVLVLPHPDKPEHEWEFLHRLRAWLRRNPWGLPRAAATAGIWLLTLKPILRLRRATASLGERMSKGRWVAWREKGAAWLTALSALAVGPFGAAFWIRVFALPERQAWKYAVLSNAFANFLRVSAYLFLGDCVAWAFGL